MGMDKANTFSRNISWKNAVKGKEENREALINKSSNRDYYEDASGLCSRQGKAFRLTCAAVYKAKCARDYFAGRCCFLGPPPGLRKYSVPMKKATLLGWLFH
ncbi:MAG: hypothetical protein JXR49_14495 [Acidobacteria bacterium]|nr:hypothetical protein [Acidobacteriota bacterium]